MKFCHKIVASVALLNILSGCMRSIHHEHIFVPDDQQITKNRQVQSTTKPVHPVLKPDHRTLIVIDAGHGGKDEGAKSNVKPRCLEKAMTLSTAKMVETYLQSFGYQTIMTRKDDTFIGLSERAKLANEKKPKLFVSVHYNAAENPKADGIEVYYYNNDSDKKRVGDSKKLAAVVLDQVISNTRGKSRGIKHGNFAVIRETKMPAILVEGGFMTNDREMEKIRESSYTKKIAWGIAQGVKKYLSSME